MKVLLITGKLAEPLIRKIISETKAPHSFDLLVLPLAVAAFLHPKYVSSQLKLRGPLEDYNLILLPGMTAGDAAIVTESTGIPTFKGTRHAADLPLLLDDIFDAESRLSTTQPADLAFAEQLTKKAEQDLDKGYQRPKGKLLEGVLIIGKGENSFAIGRRLPLRIIAEITDAPLRQEDEIIRLANYFVNSGADVIDIGMVASAPKPSTAKAIAKLIHKHIPVPVSIDSLNAQEIIGGIEGGAQLVLSLDQDNMMDIPKKYRKRATFAVIPAAQDSVELPKTLDERIQLLEDNLTNARGLGYRSLIADPLCDPLITPGLSQAIRAYAEFHQRQPNIPMLMGIGNITELLDADSPGANAVLAGLAAELGVSLLLTTEVSSKTKGSVEEVYHAARMMYLARRRRAHPKDLGIDLLRLKSKRFPELPFEPIPDAEYPIYDVTSERLTHPPDAQGYFTFHIDRRQHQIIVRHYPAGSTENPTIELKGNTAQQLIDAIITRELVSQLDHAAYIGRELAKAELALTTGRPYIQEAALFHKLKLE